MALETRFLSQLPRQFLEKDIQLSFYSTELLATEFLLRQYHLYVCGTVLHHLPLSQGIIYSTELWRQCIKLTFFSEIYMQGASY